MNTTILPAEIIAFATAVRVALADLPADEVEELTDGLEADLAEAHAEDLARELPDPAAYAEELRGAAGLPTPAPRRGRVGTIAAQFTGMGADLQRSLRTHRMTAAVLDYLATLRSAWWIVRAWAAYQCFGGIFGFEGDLLPSGIISWVLLLVLIAGSVFLGQRAWPRWGRTLIGVGNAFAIVVLLFAVAALPTRADLDNANGGGTTYYDDEYAQAPDGTGVRLNGNEVTNIFAYNARGEAINGVQLFDQDGNALATSVPGGNGCLVHDDWDGCSTPGAWMPTQLETGGTAWNVYPMKMAESTFDDPMTPVAGAVAQDRPAPFLKVPALFSSVQQDAAPAPKRKAPKKRD